MTKPNFTHLDPEDLHTCQHCGNAYIDIDKRHDGIMCPKYGLIKHTNAIMVNDCEQWGSPYVSDYRRRPDLESQLKKQ